MKDVIKSDSLVSDIHSLIQIKEFFLKTLFVSSNKKPFSKDQVVGVSVLLIICH